MNALNQSVVKFFGIAFLAALLMATMVGCASTNKQSSTGEYIDDTVITTKVKAAILEDKQLKVTEINVETFKGVVQLSGFVSTQQDINRAATLARSIEGVTSVKNDMRVK
jgi:osmotically-inducible protein OsmY